MALGFRKRSGVAVVEIFGVIGARVRVAEYARLLDSVALNQRYRALVVDIDSPGGTASGSELLYHSLRKVAQRKPVVAYIRGIGASGGYYLCCAASNVIALPTVLVGSIGVIYLRPVLEQLLGKLGVQFSVFKGGQFKDMTGFWRSPTQEESEKFQGLIAEIYDNFVSVVAQGRSMDEARGAGAGHRRGLYRPAGQGPGLDRRARRLRPGAGAGRPAWSHPAPAPVGAAQALPLRTFNGARRQPQPRPVATYRRGAADTDRGYLLSGAPLPAGRLPGLPGITPTMATHPPQQSTQKMLV